MRGPDQQREQLQRVRQHVYDQRGPRPADVRKQRMQPRLQYGLYVMRRCLRRPDDGPEQLRHLREFMRSQWAVREQHVPMSVERPPLQRRLRHLQYALQRHRNVQRHELLVLLQQRLHEMR